MSVIVRTDLEFVRERLKSPFGFKGRYLDELWQTVALIATDTIPPLRPPPRASSGRTAPCSARTRPPPPTR